MVPEKKDPLIRETLVGSYRIIYRVDESKKVVALARIWHSARGTPELYRERRSTTGARAVRYLILEQLPEL